MEPMMQAQRAQNPLFLRDAELERSLALLTLLQLELEAAIGPLLARLGIEPDDALLLARIDQAAEGEPATAAELSSFLGWTKQRMSRRLASLVDQGLVERRPTPVDRRKQQVLPTSLGSQQVAALQSLQKRHLRRIFRRAGPAEVAGFQNVLAVAAQHAGRGRQAALPGGAPSGAPAEPRATPTGRRAPAVDLVDALIGGER
jgi:DNA-binding MarR family transcriptional regulator